MSETILFYVFIFDTALVWGRTAYTATHHQVAFKMFGLFGSAHVVHIVKGSDKDQIDQKLNINDIINCKELFHSLSRLWCSQN